MRAAFKNVDQNLISLLYGAFAVWVGVVLLMTKVKFDSIVEGSSLTFNQTLEKFSHFYPVSDRNLEYKK